MWELRYNKDFMLLLEKGWWMLLVVVCCEICEVIILLYIDFIVMNCDVNIFKNFKGILK